MTTINYDTLATAIVAKLRPVVRQEIQRLSNEQKDLSDEKVDINGIADILGHSADWCRRTKNRTYPHFVVGKRIFAYRNKLTEYARHNGLKTR